MFATVSSHPPPPPPPSTYRTFGWWEGRGEGWARQHHSARNAIARRANLIARDAWSITLIPLPAIIALLHPLPLPHSHLLTVSSRLYGPHKVLSHRVNPSRAAPLNYICLLCFARRGGSRGTDGGIGFQERFSGVVKIALHYSFSRLRYF